MADPVVKTEKELDEKYVILRKGGKFALLGLLAALALVGCASLDHGTVTGKKYEPAYEYVDMICASYGKYGCRGYLPYEEWEPQHWVVELKAGGDTGSTDVDQRTWDRLKVGEQYP